MTEIIIMSFGHVLWNTTIEFADKCSWRAGPALALKMKNNCFENNERVLVAMEDSQIAAFCTFANTDELPKGYPFTPFIGFVFVDEK